MQRQGHFSFAVAEESAGDADAGDLVAIRESGGEIWELACGCDYGERTEDGAEDAEDFDGFVFLLGRRLDEGELLARWRRWGRGGGG